MSDSALQERIGARVRRRRTELGWTLPRLAEAADLSPRFVSDVEAGRSNISVVRLAGLAEALGLSLTALVREAPDDARSAIDAVLSGCDGATLERVRDLLEVVLGRRAPRIVALLGMRGAGKSTIGPLLAQTLGMPFVELDERIEARAGMRIGDLFSLHGEAFYRQLELAALEQLVKAQAPCVVALPGGVVTHDAARRLVEATCTTVWLRATPEDHWARVFAQGDTRPMQGREDARTDLSLLLARREPFYATADLVEDTSRAAPDAIVRRIALALEDRGRRP